MMYKQIICFAFSSIVTIRAFSSPVSVPIPNDRPCSSSPKEETISASFFSKAEAESHHLYAGYTGTLTGTVTDKDSGKPIAGAVIQIPDIKSTAVSDAKGYFSLNHLPRGVYLVQVSLVGYASFVQKVDFTSVSTLNVRLRTSSVETGEVVVTGESKATEAKREPVPMVILGKTYIEQHAAAGNVIDVMANLPGISALTTGPNISKPYIHGLGYNRVITMVDGIRQEGQQWGDEHGIEVDQNSIDRVEIIKGPASLSYGSDAIGGVVNLLTPVPVQEGKILGALTDTYGTNNGLFNGSLKIQGNSKGFVWGGILSEKLAKNYKNNHDGRVFATNFRETDAKVMFGLSKSWGSSYLNLSLFDDLQAIPDGSRDSISRAFTKQVTEEEDHEIVSAKELKSYSIPVLHQHVQLYRIYNNTNIALGRGNLILNLGYQYSHRREFTHPTKSDIPGLNLELGTFTYDAKYAFDMGRGYEATFGFNGMLQKNSLGSSTDFPIPAYNQFDIGPFFVIKKSYGKLDVSAGARYDTRSFHGKAAYIDTSDATFPSLYTGSNPSSVPTVVQQFGALKKNFNGISGSLGATYNFSDALLLKANIARGFRAPSIAELSANGADPGSKIFHVGDDSFKPEFSLQEDVGMFINLPILSASVEVFNNNLQHYIYQQQLLDPSGNPQQVDQNGNSDPKGQYTKFSYVQSKARIQGGEASLDIHPLPFLHFENSLSMTYGRNLGEGGHQPDSLKYLPLIPPLHTHSELRGNLKQIGKSFADLYAFIGFDHFNAQNRFLSAYSTETFTAGYNLISGGIGGSVLNAKGRKILSLYIEGTNLGNKNYQSNMSRLKYFDNPTVPAGVQPGIFNMGRNISFRLLLPFEFSAKRQPLAS